MKYTSFKERRIAIVPPLNLKNKIKFYSKGNMSAFILDAVKEKIGKLEKL